MTYFFGLIIVGLMIMVVVSLVRGIAAFLKSTREDMNREGGDGPSPMQVRQNQMMFRRIMFQGAAILVVALLMAIGHK